MRAATAKSLQSCPTLCDPRDGSPPGSAVPGILQARTLEWVAISFSNACKWKGKVKSLSRVQLFMTPWTTAYQVPPSMGFPHKSTGVGHQCRLLAYYIFPLPFIFLTWNFILQVGLWIIYSWDLCYFYSYGFYILIGASDQSHFKLLFI